MKKIIGVLSYKGGVGTSTVSCGIAEALAGQGFSVCLVDCKFCGDLDIILGVEDRRLTGFDDISGGRTLEDIVLKCESFDFCGAPYTVGAWNEEAVKGITQSGYDLVVLDSPDDPGICDIIAVVTSQNPSSVRAAECLALEVQGRGIDVGIIVNRFGEFEKSVSVESIIDSTHARLLGAVPYIPFLCEGKKSYEKDNALRNTAIRINGGGVPIFEGSKQKNMLKRILNKSSGKK